MNEWPRRAVPERGTRLAIRVAVSGLGRVSSQLIRVVHQGGFSDLFEIVAIHDSAGPEAIARAIRFDSTYGQFPGDTKLEDRELKIDGKTIALSATTDTKSLNWEKDDISIVILDGPGANDRSVAEQHVKKGARKVLTAQPFANADLSVAVGANDGAYDPDVHNIVGSASGGLAAAPIVVRMLDEQFKLRCGSITDLSPATAALSFVDRPSMQIANARGMVNNLVSSSVPVDPVLASVLGKTSDRLDVFSVAVPTTPVGLVRMSLWLEQKTSIDAVLSYFNEKAQSEELAGIFGIEDELLVAADQRGDPRSVVVDSHSVGLLYETFLNVTGWYDSEFGAACRLADLIALICEAGVPGTA